MLFAAVHESADGR